MALLIDLDWKHAPVLAGVFVLINRRAKALVDAPNAVRQNITEANQHRQLQAARLQVLHELVEIDVALVVGPNLDFNVSRFVDIEVGVPPTSNLVQLGAIAGRPGSGFGIHGTEVVTCASRWPRANQRAGAGHGGLLPRRGYESKANFSDGNQRGASPLAYQARLHSETSFSESSERPSQLGAPLRRRHQCDRRLPSKLRATRPMRVQP